MKTRGSELARFSGVEGITPEGLELGRQLVSEFQVVALAAKAARVAHDETHAINPESMLLGSGGLPNWTAVDSIPEELLLEFGTAQAGLLYKRQEASRTQKIASESKVTLKDSVRMNWLNRKIGIEVLKSSPLSIIELNARGENIGNKNYIEGRIAYHNIIYSREHLMVDCEKKWYQSSSVAAYEIDVVDVDGKPQVAIAFLD